MNALIVISIVTILISIPMLLWLSAYEHKNIIGYTQLNLMGTVLSVVFGLIPFANLFIVFCYSMYLGDRIIVWTSKK